MKRNRIIAFVFVWCLFGLSMSGQAPGSWKTYMAYHDASQVIETPHYVFAVYDGSLLSYSLEDGEIRTYSKATGLNDIKIRLLRYSSEANALLIVYENNNMDIFVSANRIYNVSYVMDQPNKTVNNVDILGTKAYLSLNTGLAVLDFNRREIKDEYYTGNTLSSCQWDDYQYVATDKELLKAPLTCSLADMDNWKTVSVPDMNTQSITKMLVFNDRLILHDNNKTMAFSKTEQPKLVIEGYLRQVEVFHNQLVLGFWSGFLFLNTALNQTGVVYLDGDFRSVASMHSPENYWVAWGPKGLAQIKLIPSESSALINYEYLISNFQPNSPLRNLSLNMSFLNNKLLVTGGGRGSDRWFLPGTFMVYENGKWLNLDDKIIAEKTGLTCMDLISAVVDPRDSHHYFVSSWGEGVYELQDTSFIKLHTYTNSSLQSTNPTYKPAEFVRTDGMAFDRNHNLFIANAGVAEGLSVLTDKGKWYSFPLIDKAQVNQLVITKDNKKWINLFRGIQIGIVIFDDNGTIENKNDDKLYFGSHFTDQQDRKVDETTYSSIAEDQNGIIWVGTDNGPITFSSAEQVQQGRCTRLVSMDERGEGYYPMEGDKVTAIAVDGANRKWIGTAGNGVHIVDQSGELKIDNLNKNNSPLISNNINSIAINGSTGEVFFATDMGICSYMSDAIDGKPDYSNVYAYPNPVHPARQSRVAITGLMQNSTVKITDLAGNLMKEAVSNGGLYTWNCTGPSGEIVKAGVYLVFGTLPDGSQGAVTKIMVIR